MQVKSLNVVFPSSSEMLSPSFFSILSRDYYRFPTKILNNRDRSLVTAIEIRCQWSDVSIVDSVEDILDRLIDYGGVFGSHRSLKNAGSSDNLASTASRSSNDGSE